LFREFLDLVTLAFEASLNLLHTDEVSLEISGTQVKEFDELIYRILGFGPAHADFVDFVDFLVALGHV